MTMMKRLAALVLVLAMLLTLAACGGDNTDGELCILQTLPG